MRVLAHELRDNVSATARSHATNFHTPVSNDNLMCTCVRETNERAKQRATTNEHVLTNKRYRRTERMCIQTDFSIVRRNACCAPSDKRSTSFNTTTVEQTGKAVANRQVHSRQCTGMLSTIRLSSVFFPSSPLNVCCAVAAVTLCVCAISLIISWTT